MSRRSEGRPRCVLFHDRFKRFSIGQIDSGTPHIEGRQVERLFRFRRCSGRQTLCYEFVDQFSHSLSLSSGEILQTPNPKPNGERRTANRDRTPNLKRRTLNGEPQTSVPTVTSVRWFFRISSPEGVSQSDWRQSENRTLWNPWYCAYRRHQLCYLSVW